MGKNENDFMKKDVSATQIQANMSKNKYRAEEKIAEMKLQVQEQIFRNEVARHDNIMKEIEALKEAGIKKFSRVE